MRWGLLLLLLVGCARPPQPAPLPPDRPLPWEHVHDWTRPGAHDGLIVVIAPDRYHAEVVFLADGTVKLYPLGRDWTRVLPVPQQTLTAHVKPKYGHDFVQVELKGVPQTGDEPEQTSQFIGQLPAGLRGQAVEMNIPNFRIGGERFMIRFDSDPHEEADMPAKVIDDAERQLYLTPAGQYTVADVQANERKTASEKYRGFRAMHDFSPRAGDRLCPITRTKVHPECSWIIGGKRYYFCCPPCIDEFVARARQSTEPLPDPEVFIQK